MTDKVAGTRGELLGGVVEGGPGIVDFDADGFQVGSEADEFVVECGTAVHDFADVFGLLLLTPETFNNAYDEEQCGGSGEENAFFVGFHPEAFVLLRGHEEGGLDRDKHDDEIGRVDAWEVGVVTVGELGDVSANAGDMALDGCLAFRLGGGFERVVIGVDGDFGINDEVTAFGELDDDVGLAAPGFAVCVFADEALLEGVVLAFAQALILEEVEEDHLSPVALGLGVATQRSGEVVGFVGEALVEGFEVGEFAGELSASDDGFFVDVLNFSPEVGEVARERVEKVTERFLVLFGEGLGVFLEDILGEKFELFGETLTVSALVGEFGFKGADAGGGGGFGGSFGVDGGLEGFALTPEFGSSALELSEFGFGRAATDPEADSDAEKCRENADNSRSHLERFPQRLLYSFR